MGGQLGGLDVNFPVSLPGSEMFGEALGKESDLKVGHQGKERNQQGMEDPQNRKRPLCELCNTQAFEVEGQENLLNQKQKCRYDPSVTANVSKESEHLFNKPSRIY